MSDTGLLASPLGRLQTKLGGFILPKRLFAFMVGPYFKNKSLGSGDCRVSCELDRHLR